MKKVLFDFHFKQDLNNITLILMLLLLGKFSIRMNQSDFSE